MYLLAYYIGTTAYADAVSLALLIPDIVGGNIIEPTICVSIIPILASRFLSKKRMHITKPSSIHYLYLDCCPF
jgi:peptidoglycan biosynthesis protein MviN/MurJ (putative lipid II flippase)